MERRFAAVKPKFISIVIYSVFVLILPLEILSLERQITVRRFVELKKIQTDDRKDCETSSKVTFDSFFKKRYGQIFLLIEPKYFKTDDLIKIFLCYSVKYPKIIYLKITAFSDAVKLKKEIDDFLHPADDVKIFSTDQIKIGYNLKRKSLKCCQAYYTRYDSERFLFNSELNETRLTQVEITPEDYEKLGLPVRRGHR